MNTIFKSKKSNRVTQSDVAKAVKLNRTTVTKILNNDPTYFPNEKTRKRVIQKAIRMGYKLNNHSSPEKINTHVNLRVAVDCFITVHHTDGTSSLGSGKALTLSAEGAIVEGIIMDDNALPITEETSLSFSGKGVDSPKKCRLTYIQYPSSKKDWDAGDKVQLGIEFVSVLKEVPSKIAYATMKHTNMN